jgi:hypothetical protein
MTLALGDNYEGQLLQLLFNATPISNIAQNNATSPLTNLFIALHTADPGTGTSSTQATSEIALTSGYTTYARVAVPRTSGGWTITGTSVAPVNTISFPTVPSGAAVVTAALTSASATMTVSAVTSGTLALGQVVTGTGIPANTYISALGTGSGGNGTYTLSANATATNASVSVTAAGVSTTTAVSSATFFTVGTAASGAGVLLFKGAISPAIAIVGGAVPRLSPIATISGSASLLRGSAF